MSIRRSWPVLLAEWAFDQLLYPILAPIITRGRDDMGLTTNPDDPELGHGVDEEPVSQNAKYLVLSEAERAQGFVRPLYRRYKHHAADCEYITMMVLPLCETYARQPSYYGATYCCGCRKHRPVGAHGEFTWIDDAGNDTQILVGT